MDTDNRLERTNLICFPVYRVHFFVGGAKVYSQTRWEGAMAAFVTLYTRHCKELQVNSKTLKWFRYGNLGK